MLKSVLLLLVSLMTQVVIHESARADCKNIGFVILRSSVVKEDVYDPFVKNDCVKEAHTVFGNIDYNPLTANQPENLDKLKELVEDTADSAARGIVILAYSEAGKFAAKLASLYPEVKALFLMDPVDGTPPFSSPKRFPIYLDENFPQLKIPTMILESEFGPKFKRLGFSCVNEEMGPKRFYRHVASDQLHRVFMEGLGHADFLDREGFSLVEVMCGGGKLPKDVAFQRVTALWRKFLEQVVPLL
jgi:hypothetical protein